MLWFLNRMAKLMFSSPIKLSVEPTHRIIMNGSHMDDSLYKEWIISNHSKA